MATPEWSQWPDIFIMNIYYDKSKDKKIEGDLHLSRQSCCKTTLTWHLGSDIL